MLTLPRNSSGSQVDRALAALSPYEVVHRVEAFIGSSDDAALKGATEAAAARMSAAERTQLELAFGNRPDRGEVGDVFFEGGDVDAGALIERVRASDDIKARLRAFLRQNPRAIAAFEPALAARMLQLPPPRRPQRGRIAIAAGASVFVLGAITAFGAMIVPRPAEPSTSAPVAVQPAVRTAAPAAVRPAPPGRNVTRPPRREPPHRAAAPVQVASIQHTPRPAPVQHAAVAPARHPAHRRAPPRRHGNTVHRQIAAAVPEIPPTPPPAPATDAPQRKTIWQRLFPWLRKHHDSTNPAPGRN